MSRDRRNTRQTDPERIADEAALWLARRDRGLTPAEQDEYLQWLRAGPRHVEVLAQHAAAFERMAKLYEWQPGQSADANPDLFAPPATRRWQIWLVGLAAAAVLAVCAGWWWGGMPLRPAPASPHAFLRVNERQELPDGSIVEFKDGSRVTVMFSPAERRVDLTGEAHFHVAKSSVPFLVQVGTVTVRAVGTAFNVRAELGAVEVLVTEGTVAVQTAPAGRGEADTTEALAPEATTPAAALPGPGAEPARRLIVAGQRAVVPAVSSAALEVDEMTPEQILAALAWKVPRLQFNETPLRVAVEEFNQRNHTRIILGDRDLAAIPIGGTFRIDQVESFIRTLEIALDVQATRRSGEIVLSRGR